MLPIYRTPKSVYNYDQLPAGHYFKAMTSGRPEQRFWHEKKFDSVIDRINDGARVLDLGCGPGSFLYRLHQRRPQCVGLGVDLASPQIEFANATVAKESSSKIQFEVLKESTLQSLRAKDTFDVVSCIEVIEHIHPFLVNQMFTDVKLLLKPGTGRLIVTTPNYRSLWPFVELGLERLSPVQYHDQHINRFTPNSFVKFLETVGFQVTSLSTLFIVSPFLAAIGRGFAESVLRLERQLFPSLGSLLIAEAKMLQISDL